MRWAWVLVTNSNYEESPNGSILRPRRIDYSRLGTLHGKIPSGHPPFDIEKFRSEPYDPSFQD